MMVLVARLGFDDEDPTMHAHFTAHAHQLEDTDPREWLRVLRVMADALDTYAGEIRTVVDRAQIRVDADDEALAARGDDDYPPGDGP